ncbi:MAG: hypothetical protein WC962_05655 [Phycisphaerae bacterium]|jgi:hypothetical protein
MVDIPLDKDLLKKRFPDKFKENCETQSNCSKPQGNDESVKPQNKRKVEKSEQQIVQTMIDAGRNLFGDEIQYFLGGDIERTTEFDKYIVEESDNIDLWVKSQFAYLAKESAYIGRHLERWVEEKIDDKVANWYGRAECAFTYRVIAIQPVCENIESVLLLQFPALRGDLKVGYKKMIEVAVQCNIARAKWFGRLPVEPIREFKLAAAEFHEIIYAIHIKAIIELRKLIQPAKSKKPGQPKNKAAEKAIDSLKELLKDESNFTDMPRGTKSESWEWIADKIGYPENSQNETPRYKIMQGYLRRNSQKLYEKLKSIMEKN